MSLFLDALAAAIAPISAMCLCPQADTRNHFMVDGGLAVVSRGLDGGGGNSASGRPSLSADGSCLTFESDASNLTHDDTNNKRDVFVMSRDGAIVRIQNRGGLADDSDRVQPNGTSANPQISPDGGFICFESDADNLVAGDSNCAKDVFLYDVARRTIALMSIDNDGTPGTASAFSPAVASEGRVVVFVTTAANLTDSRSRNCLCIVRRDVAAKRNKLITRARDGVSANGDSRAPQISSDGATIVFASDASNLVSGDNNAASDVFLWSAKTETLERVSIGADGKSSDGGSSWPTVSDDARFVAFVSSATNLVQDGGPSGRRPFVRDRVIGKTLVASATGPSVLTMDDCRLAPISRDGRIMVCVLGSVVVEGSTVPGGMNQIVRVELETNRWGIITSNGSKEFANGMSGFPALSANGDVVALSSCATNLLPAGEFVSRACDVYSWKARAR